jgi:hypothetical protein
MTTYSTSLKLALIGDGQEVGTWGQTTNTNLGTLLEQAIAGSVSINMGDANVTLTSLNGTSDQARNQVIIATGTNSAVRDIIPPVVEKTYIVVNNTTGGFAIRVIGTTGTGVSVPNGTTSLIYCNGTNFVEAINSNTITGNAAVSGALAVTGAISGSTATFSGAISSVSPTFTGTPVAPTANPGTNTTQIATTAFVLANGIPSGAIMLWSGAIGSIPSGWALCDGNNGTPDLRNRFIVGAGSTYAVGATGGSADAIVVSHTHTATSSVSDPGHVHFSTNNGATNGLGAGAALTNSLNSPGYATASAFTGISVSTSVASAGSSGTNANLPPYYALAYIMKT